MAKSKKSNTEVLYQQSPLTKMQETNLLDRLGGDWSGFLIGRQGLRERYYSRDSISSDVFPTKIKQAQQLVERFNAALDKLKDHYKEKLYAVQDRARREVVFAKSPEAALQAVETALGEATRLGEDFRGKVAKL